MNSKENVGKILMACLMFGLLVTGINLTAEDTPTTNAYISVPMCFYNKMTGNEKEQAQEYYTYQDGKLTKCTADLPEKGLKEKDGNCDKKNKKHSGRHRKMFKDNKHVLLTVSQFNDLMKEKLQEKLNDFDNPKSKMATALNEAEKKAETVKINGQDAKVISFSSLHKIKEKNMDHHMMKQKNAEKHSQ